MTPLPTHTPYDGSSKLFTIGLKPLEVSEGGVLHGGGAKFSGTDDVMYRSILSFVEYWQGCGAEIP